MKIIEQIKFKLSGKSVPAIKVADVDSNGRVGTLQDVGPVKDRPNSLVDGYYEKGWEKSPGVAPVTFVDQKGNKDMRWIVSESGRTVNLFVDPYLQEHAPSREDVIGRAATMDDLAEAMDLGRSMKNLMLGLLLGVGIGCFILAPALSKVLS